MTNMTLRVAIIILVICVGRVVSSSYCSTSDLTGFGGNQGWGLGFFMDQTNMLLFQIILQHRNIGISKIFPVVPF